MLNEHFMKYVCFTTKDGEVIRTFEHTIFHSTFAERYPDETPVSAGFVIEDECTGSSVSLNLHSRPVDTDIYREQKNATTTSD